MVASEVLAKALQSLDTAVPHPKIEAAAVVSKLTELQCVQLVGIRGSIQLLTELLLILVTMLLAMLVRTLSAITLAAQLLHSKGHC